MPKNHVRLWECRQRIYCDTYMCRNLARWQIGHQQGPLSLNLHLCHDCAEAILSNLPEKLKPEPELVEVPVVEEVAQALLEPEETKSNPLPKEPPFICPTCGKEFKNFGGLLSHQRVHK